MPQFVMVIRFFYQVVAISHVWDVSFIVEPRKASPPYSTAASTWKSRDICRARDDYNKELILFRMEWKPFPKLG
jgi:hypothetical protein